MPCGAVAFFQCSEVSERSTDAWRPRSVYADICCFVQSTLRCRCLGKRLEQKWLAEGDCAPAEYEVTSYVEAFHEVCDAAVAGKSAYVDDQIQRGRQRMHLGTQAILKDVGFIRVGETHLYNSARPRARPPARLRPPLRCMRAGVPARGRTGARGRWWCINVFCLYRSNVPHTIKRKRSLSSTRIREGLKVKSTCRCAASLSSESSWRDSRLRRTTCQSHCLQASVLQASKSSMLVCRNSCVSCRLN